MLWEAWEPFVGGGHLRGVRSRPAACQLHVFPQSDGEGALPDHRDQSGYEVPGERTWAEADHRVVEKEAQPAGQSL